MMQWNLQSNVCDVLALGPRTAGQLATVGIQTVAELIAARPQVVAARIGERSLTADIISTWQCESRLILDLPQLPAKAARLLAAAGYGSSYRIGHCSPTELLAELESAKQKNSVGWLAGTPLPTVVEAGEWIYIAQRSKKSFAA